MPAGAMPMMEAAQGPARPGTGQCLAKGVVAVLRRGKPGLSSGNADVHKTGSCFIKVECTSCFLAL